MPAFDTLWTKDLTPGLKIVVKSMEQQVGAAGTEKVIWFYLQTAKGEILIQPDQVQALMAMAPQRH